MRTRSGGTGGRIRRTATARCATIRLAEPAAQAKGEARPWLAPRARLSFLQRQQLDLAEEHLRPFRLEDDLPLRVARIGAGVDHGAVEDVGDLVPIADAFEAVPFADRPLQVFLS